METTSGHPAARRESAKYELLVDSRQITSEDLEAAVREAGQLGKDPASILISRHGISKQAIGDSLGSFYKCPFLAFSENYVISRDLTGDLSPQYLKTNHWLPLIQEGSTVHVLIDDPLATDKIQDIQHMFPRKNIRLYVGLREDIALFIDSLGKKSQAQEKIETIIDQLAVDQDPMLEKTVEPEPALRESDSVVIRLANQILIDACKAGASDVHVEPYSRAETVIRFRVDGECSIYQKIPSRYRKALAARIKVMAGLDISEHRKPQDGKLSFRIHDRLIEVRVAVVPTANDIEDIVMRLLASSEPIPLQNINLSEKNLRDLTFLLGMPHGLILCAGPTGSGKTTTLHSALWYVNGPHVKIWTAEDPVEITQYGLRQVQVQPKIGFTFAAALRSFLRADPDIVMVGEMRDKETIEIGIQASLTGHLVLSTLHTNSAVETVSRLLDMGMDPFSFADALQGVLAQRLVRTICVRCEESYHPPRQIYDELAREYGAEAWARLGIAYDDKFTLYRGKGCEACHKTGYKGRTGLHELLVVTDPIRKLIQERAPVSELARAGHEAGMSSLLQDGILKCLKGDTDISQVKAVA